MGIAPFDLGIQPLPREIEREEQRRKIAEAKRFILHSLANGPQFAALLLEAAAEWGIAEGILYYAKRALGVQSTRRGYQHPWVWSFAEQTAETAEDPVFRPAGEISQRHNGSD